jgi:predicted esterase
MNEENEPAGRIDGPHQGQRVAEAGAPLHRAKAAVILVHGRGATAESILTLADEFAQPDVAYLAPQAAGNTWYPYSFLAPTEQNEPGLSSGLQAIRDVRGRIEQAGLPAERTVLLGFSQGACLALEFAARHARRYGGAVALSGGLIGTGPADGPPPDDKRFDYAGALDKTPVFLGCSDVDAHIPLARVHRSSEVLRALGGVVTERIYPGMGHTVNEDEVKHVRGLLAGLVARA